MGKKLAYCALICALGCLPASARKFRREGKNTTETSSEKGFHKRKKVKTKHVVAQTAPVARKQQYRTPVATSIAPQAEYHTAPSVLVAQQQHTMPTSSTRIALTPTPTIQMTQNNITMDKKISLTRRFRNNIDLISTIVMEGEMDEYERQDFGIRFEAQRRWFTHTIEQSKTYGDAKFLEASQKLQQIEEIANAVQDADRLLAKTIEKNPRPEPEIRQLRTQILYEINIQLEQHKNRQTISNKEIAHIVNKTIQKFDRTKEIPQASSLSESQIVELCKKSKVVDDLQNQNRNLMSKLKRINEEKNRITASLNRAKSTGANEELIREINNLKKTRDELRAIAAREAKARLDLEIKMARNPKQCQKKTQQPIANNRSHLKSKLTTQPTIKLAKKQTTIDNPYAAFDNIADLFN